MDVQFETFPIDIFTPHYRISGAWMPRGAPAIYLNNESVQTLLIEDATVIPLRPGVDLEPIFTPKMYIPKRDPQVIILGNITMESVRPFPRRELLVCLTDLLIMKGYFHLAMESNLQDAFSLMTPQQFLFVSSLEVASIYSEATGVRTNAMMAFVNKNAVHGYYIPEPEDNPGQPS